MGLYDREYYREERRGLNLGGDWYGWATLISINVGVFVLDLFSPETAHGGRWLSDHLAIQPNLLHEPWNCWQLLTYGFAHDPNSIWHLVFNMVGLWWFGSEVEVVYGKREFYKIYLSLIILAGLTNVVVQASTGHEAPVIGASGGVMGLAVIYACHFPMRIINIYGIFPVPVVVLVTVYIAADLLGARAGTDNVAHWAHLGGALFGFIDYKTRWNLFRLWPGKIKLRLPRKRPKFRIHRESDDNEEEVAAPVDEYMTTGRIQARVDQLLAKISASGEGSLTDEERQFLADAARRYQQRRR
jgi:membrane associated rhomboid family serine protease